MTNKLSAPLVGMYFRPPAGLVVRNLPSGAVVTLVPEPENPYDVNAVAVFADPKQVPESRRGDMEDGLEGHGHTWEDLMAQDVIQLGYVAKSSGKDCAKLGLKGNEEFLPVIEGPTEGRLEFHPTGAPMVTIEMEQQS